MRIGSNPRIQQGYESFLLVGWGETHGPPFAFYGELVAQGHFVAITPRVPAAFAVEAVSFMFAIILFTSTLTGSPSWQRTEGSLTIPLVDVIMVEWQLNFLDNRHRQYFRLPPSRGALKIYWWPFVQRTFLPLLDFDKVKGIFLEWMQALVKFCWPFMVSMLSGNEDNNNKIVRPFKTITSCWL